MRTASQQSGSDSRGMSHGSGSLLFVLPGTSLAAAPKSEQRVSSPHSLFARFEAWIRITECSTPLGPRLSLHASLSLPALEARVIFRPAPPGSHAPSEEVVRQLMLVRPGERLVRPWRPVRGIPRGAEITLRVLARDGSLLEEEPVGECQDRFHDVVVPLALDVNAVAWIVARDWSERGAPRIRSRGELVFNRGATVRLGFRGKDGRAGEGVGGVDLVRAGTALFSAEKLCDAGLQNNRWVSVQFADESGRPIGDEHLVGRCVRA